MLLFTLLLFLSVFPSPQERPSSNSPLVIRPQASFPCPPLTVGSFYLGLSPQGNSIWVQFEKDKAFYLQVNEKIYGGSGEQFTSEPLFAMSDEDRYCFTYRKNKLEYLATSWNKVYGGVPAISSLAISADGKEVAFAYPINKDKSYFINLNNQPYLKDSFDWVGNLHFLKDGDLVFTYMQGPLKYFLYRKNQVLGPFSSSPYLGVAKDSSHYGLISAKGNAYFIMLEGQIVHEEQAYLTDLTLSCSGKNYAWVSVVQDKCFVNSVSKRFGPYEDISYIFFSEDETKLGFVFKNRTGSFVQFTESRAGPFFAIRDASYSASGAHKAFVFLKALNDENSYLQIDEKVIASFKGPISIRWRGEDLLIGYYEKEALHLAVLSLK